MVSRRSPLLQGHSEIVWIGDGAFEASTLLAHGFLMPTSYRRQHTESLVDLDLLSSNLEELSCAACTVRLSYTSADEIFAQIQH